jgi:predicted TIM-barrel fold metal-dependent hydrolase
VRQVNEYTAGLVAKWPERFGNFAVLPLPDIDAALEEVAFALDTLHADGVVVFSNYGERYLGDPFLGPLWAELDRRGAVVFVHPTRLVQPELEGIPAPFVDFPFATTRAAVEMVTNGVMDRYRNMRVILSHGGGFLPYAAYRFASFGVSGPPGSTKSPSFDTDMPDLLDTFRRFYIDTALSSSPTALPSMKAFADPTRILFGSDYPYAPGGISENFIAMLDQSPLLSPDERTAIDRGNAEVLFPNRRR